MVRARGLLLLLVLLAGLNACGSVNGRTARPADPPTIPAAEQSATAAAYPGTVRLSATEIRKTRAGVAITVDLQGGPPGCAVRPQARVADATKDVIRIEATMHTSGKPECVDTSVEPATLPVGLDLRGRDLSVNEELWERGPGGTFVRCGGLGCDPPRDRCDPVYTHDLGADADIAPERHLDVLACDAPWLVADVEAVVTGCQSVDGSTPPPGCDVFRYRWFAHLEHGSWEVVGSGPDGGCAQVLDQVPDFPRRLCSGLPPLEGHGAGRTS
jgi:hypothetical protein